MLTPVRRVTSRQRAASRSSTAGRVNRHAQVDSPSPSYDTSCRRRGRLGVCLRRPRVVYSERDGRERTSATSGSAVCVSVAAAAAAAAAAVATSETRSTSAQCERIIDTDARLFSAAIDAGSRRQVGTPACCLEVVPAPPNDEGQTGSSNTCYGADDKDGWPERRNHR